MNKHVESRKYMGTVIMEAAAERAQRDNQQLPCFGRHCSGEHQLPIPMFYAPPRDFPSHVVNSFVRGIPLPQESPYQSPEKIAFSGSYGKSAA